MNIMFDPAQDILQVSFRVAPVHETSQISPGLILDYDEDGNVIGLEVRQASQRVEDPQSVTWSVGCVNLDKPPTSYRTKLKSDL